MAKIEKKFAGKDGWCEWVSPKMNTPYRLCCCDCGLVHDFQFKVIKVSSRRGKRWWGERVHGMKVEWRARRNKKSTGQVRRWMEKE